MDVIYRFLRPIQFNTRGNMLETSPRGGVCLKITRGGPDDILQYSVCPDTAYFSKSAARHQAGLMEGIPVKPSGYSFLELHEWVSDPQVNLAMEKILHHNNLAVTQQQVYLTAVSALKLQARYHELQYANG